MVFLENYYEILECLTYVILPVQISCLIDFKGFRIANGSNLRLEKYALPVPPNLIHNSITLFLSYRFGLLVET